MSEPSVPDGERAAFFDELMRIEHRQNRPPVSGLAVAALVFAVAFVCLAYLFVGLFMLVVGAAALVFGVFAVPQIKHRERRGLVFVLVAAVVLAGGVAVVMA